MQNQEIKNMQYHQENQKCILSTIKPFSIIIRIQIILMTVTCELTPQVDNFTGKLQSWHIFCVGSNIIPKTQFNTGGDFSHLYGIYKNIPPPKIIIKTSLFQHTNIKNPISKNSQKYPL
jgi:hypothetical protein